VVRSNPWNMLDIPRRPTVAIVGAGAIGLVVADALSASSSVLLCRRATTAAMTLEIDGATRTVDAAVAGSPAGLAPVDWVVVTTKAQDTAATGPWLEALVGPDTRVVVLQNGIGHAERVAPWAPAERVLPGIVYIAAEKVGRDHVVCRSVGSLALAASSDAEDFAALVAATVPVRLVDDFVTESWSKLVMNSALNTITALTDRTMEVTGDAGVRPLIRSLLVEAVEVATAQGARFPQGSAELFLAKMDALPRNSATSMLLDRRAGRPLEHAYLTGAVVAAAARAGIAVPHLALVHSLIEAVDAGAMSLQKQQLAA
jgi:2-dehydropantoate 2-reductase